MVAGENQNSIEPWKERGKTTAILFGRFQPLHRGHVALINTIRATGLDLHILLDNHVNGDRNIFSPAQKRKMFADALPDFPQQNLHDDSSEFGRGGDLRDVVADVERLISTIAPADKCVIFYTRKPEDLKDRVLNGKTLKRSHYVDLFAPPHGKFDVQNVPPELTHSPVYHATHFRQNPNNGDALPDGELDYIKAQRELAARNHRPLGESKAADDPTVDGTYCNEPLPIGEFQKRMLQDGKRVIFARDEPCNKGRG